MFTAQNINAFDTTFSILTSSFLNNWYRSAPVNGLSDEAYDWVHVTCKLWCIILLFWWNVRKLNLNPRTSETLRDFFCLFGFCFAVSVWETNLYHTYLFGSWLGAGHSPLQLVSFLLIWSFFLPNFYGIIKWVVSWGMFSYPPCLNLCLAWGHFTLTTSDFNKSSIIYSQAAVVVTTITISSLQVFAHSYFDLIRVIMCHNKVNWPKH